ncbi:MAG: hypothetical protein Q9227_003896 [Pyrenula ochraceoflavens]
MKMGSVNRLTELSSVISEKTAQLTERLEDQGFPNPSFAWDSPADLPQDPQTRQLRNELISATEELRDLTVGASDSLRYLTWNNDAVSLHAVSAFKIAQHVPAPPGSISYGALSAATSLPVSTLYRILRHAMCNRIFAETSDGEVVHTAMSRLLADNQASRDWVGMFTEDLWSASTRTVDAFKEWPGSEEPAETGVAKLWGKGWFELIKGDSERAKRFGGAMRSMAEGPGWEEKWVVEGWNWGALGKAKIVDVSIFVLLVLECVVFHTRLIFLRATTGKEAAANSETQVAGATGNISIALARAFPSLDLVVQDLPHMVPHAEANIPADLHSRIAVQAYDFFTPQPVTDADVYFYRNDFHNWSDAYALKMLAALKPAMKQGARLLIIDTVLPAKGEADAFEEKLVRTLDILMLFSINAKERELADWESLLERSGGWGFVDAKKQAGSKLWVLEWKWEGEFKGQENLAIVEGDAVDGEVNGVAGVKRKEAPV